MGGYYLFGSVLELQCFKFLQWGKYIDFVCSWVRKGFYYVEFGNVIVWMRSGGVVVDKDYSLGGCCIVKGVCSCQDKGCCLRYVVCYC